MDAGGAAETIADTGFEWRTAEGLVAYPEAVAFMEARAAAIRARTAAEMVWLVEHPPLYTAGTSAKAGDLIDAGQFPVYQTGRGGQYTYHGPGQRVAYVMLDLKTRGQDVRRFVHDLEDWLIQSLAQLGVTGERRAGRVGIWVARPGGLPSLEGGVVEDKIAALGVRLRHWVSFHGVAINLNPDLSHYAGIVPCGIREHGVTSLAQLGVKATMADLDRALRRSCRDVFGR